MYSPKDWAGDLFWSLKREYQGYSFYNIHMALHPVLELMRKRKREGTTPGLRRDGRRLALVIEGGAIRGVVSAGMISALEDLGLRDTFDDIYATSVGVITGAYFMAGQGKFGTTTYVDDLRDSRFFSWRRLLQGQAPLSLEYAYDQLTHIDKPLDTKSVLSSAIQLHPIVACLETQGLESLSDYETAEELRLRFKAASCMPFLAGGPIEINGKRYFDGGIFESLPYHYALADGASDVLVLHSWPRHILRPEAPFIERAIGNRVMRRYGETFLKAYQSRINRYNEDLLDLEERTLLANKPHTFSLSPSKEATIHHLEKDRDLVIQARDSGYKAARNILEELTEEE